ncbi:hypothetical protein ACIRJM_22620 [Streptomyces sp. NPDC102405]|uniref:hypothetical protein n=1 Tax=Streptomyces sp. NPDC102405 TaxID=3366170 RepID=UPI003823A209
MAEQRIEVCSACHVELCVTCGACYCCRGQDWVCGFAHCPAGSVLAGQDEETRDPEAEEIERDIQREA